MELSIQKRTIFGKKVSSLRKQSIIPATIYSKEFIEGIHIQFDKNSFIKLYNKIGTSTPMELSGDWVKKQLVLVHDIQTHPVTDALLHVDFLAVRKDKKVTADVSIILIGMSPAQKNNIWAVQLLKDSLEVEAFPQDLPHDIQIDVSSLEHLHDVIFVKDINVWNKVVIKDDENLAIVTITEIGVEESDVAETQEQVVS